MHRVVRTGSVIRHTFAANWPVMRVFANKLKDPVAESITVAALQENHIQLAETVTLLSSAPSCDLCDLSPLCVTSRPLCVTSRPLCDLSPAPTARPSVHLGDGEQRHAALRPRPGRHAHAGGRLFGQVPRPGA